MEWITVSRLVNREYLSSLIIMNWETGKQIIKCTHHFSQRLLFFKILLSHKTPMQKGNIFVVEWLNKHFSVQIANDSAGSPQRDLDRVLIDYLRPMVHELYPKFVDQEATDLEFLLKPGHFVSSVSIFDSQFINRFCLSSLALRRKMTKKSTIKKMFTLSSDCCVAGARSSMIFQS